MQKINNLKILKTKNYFSFNKNKNNLIKFAVLKEPIHNTSCSCSCCTKSFNFKRNFSNLSTTTNLLKINKNKNLNNLLNNNNDNNILVLKKEFCTRLSETISELEERKTLKKFTREQVAFHNRKTDCWVIIDYKVYNLTDWLSDHPGGAIFLNYAGMDATAAFYAGHHTEFANALKSRFLIGYVEGEERYSLKHHLVHDTDFL
eukprot:TRINITY_DN948_c0_g2_i1.p1 TRINITY_DN948_c0_g2~~TRINITY_DN948_c0_g2_i1.p1  ORF type:complete len:203 (-),score=64.68 TRINITY_DN948_c0_g2_i1:73-681(-)